jgi:hypothetical protein
MFSMLWPLVNKLAWLVREWIALREAEERVVELLRARQAVGRSSSPLRVHVSEP